MISELSRYAEARIQYVDSDRGHQPALYPGPIFYNGQRYQVYVVSEGEEFAMLARRFYKDPGLYWRIADANPQVFYPEDLVAGSVLRIPT